MSLFALVHGGAHGGWCWELLVPELEKRGHSTVAPDLPIEDDAAGAREYARVVAAALPTNDDDVVVVGHSLGGLTIPWSTWAPSPGP
jgi:pimeloyl-ACP methyl ester carboxylesterase